MGPLSIALLDFTGTTVVWVTYLYDCVPDPLLFASDRPDFSSTMVCVLQWVSKGESVAGGLSDFFS